MGTWAWVVELRELITTEDKNKWNIWSCKATPSITNGLCFHKVPSLSNTSTMVFAALELWAQLQLLNNRRCSSSFSMQHRHIWHLARHGDIPIISPGLYTTDHSLVSTKKYKQNIQAYYMYTWSSKSDLINEVTRSGEKPRAGNQVESRGVITRPIKLK